MSVQVYIGDDPTLLAAIRDTVTGPVDHLELPRDGIDAVVVASETAPLFGGTRTVWITKLDALTVTQADALNAAGRAEHLRIVGHATKINLPAARTRLGKNAMMIGAPRGKEAAARRIGELCDELHPTLNPRVKARLVAMCGTDLLRAGSVLRALVTLDMTDPTPRQLEALIGERHDRGPWQVTDALERGELGKALAALEREDPADVWYQLRKRMEQVATLQRNAAASEGDAAAMLRIPPFSARALQRLAKTWNPVAVLIAVDDITSATPISYGGADARDHLACLLVRVHQRLR
jgi:DNA polymerase III delta subunit